MPADRLAPSSAEGIADLLKADPDATVTVRGGGSKSRPAATDVTISTLDLNRVVEHAAGDLIVTVQPGVLLSDLQTALAGSGQWLALDPPEPGATIGGIVAAAASGPRRLRWGTPRDLVIGMTVVLADGTIAKSGGKVVKNVAGYDLGKLFTGSFGTLGVIAEITLRLHPKPVALRAVTAVRGGGPADVARAVRTVKTSGVVASAIEWDGAALIVVVEGSERAASAQAETVAAAIQGEVSDHLPQDFGARPWRGLEDTGLKVTHRLGALEKMLETIAALMPGARVSAHAGTGVIWVGDEATGVGTVDALRAAAGRFNGEVVVVTSPPAAGSLDRFGTARGIEVMRRIKDQFDPEHRMAPGTFVGGI